MKIKSFYLNSDKEVIVKIVKEILTLFKVEISEQGPFAYEKLEIINEQQPGPVQSVSTRLTLIGDADLCFSRTSKAEPDERPGAALHRMIKLNLYHIFVEDLGKEKAPWGILHGVRPTKIVHRYIGEGLAAAAIIARLQRDYEVSEGKAAMITELAFKQRPFLATSDDRTVSVYIGIPFCLSRCLYCSFPAYVLPGEKQLQAFLSVLKQDLLAARDAIRQHGLKVQSIYIGGGTPTSLPEAQFDELLGLARESFYGPETMEFTVEAGRPDSITEAKIHSMMAYGVDRVSVNPQTMQARTLQRIGRNHTPEDVVAMFQRFRAAKMKHINMDLIIGLPGETPADIKDTMAKVTALEPDDITLHALALKKGSRLKLQLEDIELPSDQMVQEMFAIAMREVDRLGLKPYYLYRQGYMSGQMENVGCSIAGAESMYNIQIMEENQTIIGIGGAATTKVIHPLTRRLQTSFNAKDLTTYLNCVDKYIEKRSALLAEAFDH